jgi:hypothetical protein
VLKAFSNEIGSQSRLFFNRTQWKYLLPVIKQVTKLHWHILIFLFLTKTVSKQAKDRGDSQMKAFFLATLLPKDARRVWEGLIKLFRAMLRYTKVAG